MKRQLKLVLAAAAVTATLGVAVVNAQIVMAPKALKVAELSKNLHMAWWRHGGDMVVAGRTLRIEGAARLAAQCGRGPRFARQMINTLRYYQATGQLGLAQDARIKGDGVTLAGLVVNGEPVTEVLKRDVGGGCQQMAQNG